MTTIQTILEAADQLSPIDQLELIQSLSHRLQQHYRIQEATVPRVLGLHESEIIISNDFGDELPNSFWLGDDKWDYCLTHTYFYGQLVRHVCCHLLP